MKLWLVFLLGFLFSLALVAGLVWVLAAYETKTWAVWNHDPRMTQAQLFGIIRNAVTAGAALGVGITLFFSFRKQQATEKQLEISNAANFNAAESLILTREAMLASRSQHARDLDVTRESLAITREQNVSDYEDRLRARYSTAAQQIGDANASLAAAGIISMASVADEWHRLNRNRDRDDCIRMLVAGLPGDSRPIDDANIIRSTCHSIFDQRMTSIVDGKDEWWKAGIDFTTTRAAFGPIQGWVFDGSRVKIRCDQLANGGISVIQDITIDGGLLEISMQTNEEYLLVHNADIRMGGIDVKFGGLTPNKSTKVVISALQASGGRIKFEEPNRPSLERILVFQDCNFEAPNIALSPYCDNYEIVFERCHFAVKPFVHLNQIRGRHPVLRLEGNNTFSKEMTGFPINTPQELLSREKGSYSTEEDCDTRP